METMESFAADKYNLDTEELEDEFNRHFTQSVLLNYCKLHKIKGRGNTKKNNLVKIVVNYILAILKEKSYKEESMQREEVKQSEINLSESFTENIKQSDSKPKTIAEQDEDYGAIDPGNDILLEEKKTKYSKNVGKLETMELFAADKYDLDTEELEDEFNRQFTQSVLLNYCKLHKIKGRGNTKKNNLVKIVVNYILAILKEKSYKEESTQRKEVEQSEINLSESFTKNIKQSDTKPKTITEQGEDYGAIDPGDGMSLEEKKKKFLEKMILTTDGIKKIERDTVGQQKNDEWKERRKYRLTASNFGKVCKLRPTTSRENTVKSMLYNKFKGNDATRYGNENEPIACATFQKSIKETIEPAGLFIHKEKPYLAASPDGLIGKNAILEIKCPISIKEYTPEEAVANKKLKYLTYCSIDEKLILKRTDTYYYQVQGQLNITERNYCYFVVWSPKGFTVDKIARDVDFWNDKIEPFVTKFYLESLLPEIIEKRHEQRLPIRTGLPEKDNVYNTRSKSCKENI